MAARGLLFGRSGTATAFALRAASKSFAPRRTLHVSAVLAKRIAFNLADIGEGIAEAQVTAWYVKEGDKVRQFDPICQVQSDKASVEITSKYDGQILKLHHAENDFAKVGKPLIDIDVADSASAPGKAAATPAPSTAATAPTPSSTSSSTSTSSSSSSGGSSSSTGTEGKSKALMTPAVRRLVREHNINLQSVASTGKDGRVLKEDVLRFLENPSKAAPPAPAPTAPSTPTPTPTPTKSAAASSSSSRATSQAPLAADKVEPIRGIKKAMAKSMVEALKVPHFGYADEFDMSAMVKVRTSLKAAAEAKGIKLSYMPFIMKAASLALHQFPMLNAHVNADCTEMVYRQAHNIGVAMDTPNGLIVPNVKNVQSKSVIEIASELNRLQALGKAAKLTTEDLTGGTFSLSNIGVVGGTYLGPVLVVPEVCIGALGRVRKLPRFDDEENVIAAHIMEVSWSADHRVIDGMTVALFSNLMKSYLENPASMLLDTR